MSGRIYNVLFLCAGGSARSILAEALVEHWGKGRFKRYSGGSFARGTVHPFAIGCGDGRGNRDRAAQRLS